MSERVIVVSSDSHAGVPKELWPKYLDPEFHDLIPQLEEDNHVYPTVIALLSAKSGSTTGLPEQVEAHREGWHGLHDAVLRLADMDREGIAAELIFHGDARLGDLFHNATNREYPLEAWEAGAKAWNRWAADNFGFALDRFLLTGAVGPCVDMDAAVAEVHWLADHGFVGTYLPGYMRHPGMPPLYDPSWEPFWKACEDRGLVLVVHAGYGTRQGFVFPHLQRIYDAVADAAGSTDPEAMLAHSSAVSDDSLVFFDNFLSHNVDSRQPLWQLIMGGVFDRHPALRLFLTEIRLDWIPATLVHLDGVYEAHPGGFLGPAASPASTGAPAWWPAPRSSTRSRSRCATRSGWSRSCSAGTSRIPRARGPTPGSGCGTPSPACPRTRCARSWAATPSDSSGSTKSAWPNSPSASVPRSRRSTAEAWWLPS